MIYSKHKENCVLNYVFINFQNKMNELQEEEEKLRKIINIVKPTALPELTKPQVEEVKIDNPIEEKIELKPKLSQSTNDDQPSIKHKSKEEINPAECPIKQNIPKLPKKNIVEEKESSEKETLKKEEGMQFL